MHLPDPPSSARNGIKDRKPIFMPLLRSFDRFVIRSINGSRLPALSVAPFYSSAFQQLTHLTKPCVLPPFTLQPFNDSTEPQRYNAKALNWHLPKHMSRPTELIKFMHYRVYKPAAPTALSISF